jgi:hypothetical protein
MTVDTTIGVSKEAKKQAKDAKHDNETWDEFIQRCTDEPPEIVEFTPAEDGADIDVDALRDTIREEIDTIDTLAYQGALTDAEADRIISTLRTVEERTGRLEQMLEEMGAQR